ncbi:unnamed protein product [Lymnaea stagnalis]|uniref:Rab proteins geranylgeranyltransferase component A n=1 Tax=Lymnaea stagnalis TaxID=6523 RepID=A0AAV2I3K4_LYMST
MATEDLPSEFDIVILGTGLIETITAAAFSRIGLKILHLDRNDYYGGAYSNFNLDGIESWKQKNQDLQCVPDEESFAVSDDVKKLLQDQETIIPMSKERSSAFNITSQFHARQRTTIEEAEAKKTKCNLFTFLKTEASNTTASPSATANPVVKISDGQGDGDPQDSDAKQQSTSGSETQEQTVHVKQDSDVNSCTEQLQSSLVLTDAPQTASQDVGEKENTSGGGEREREERDDIHKRKAESSEEENNEQKQAQQSLEREKIIQVKEWTVGDIKDDWRKYCIDISPKFLYCSGDLVELLIQSDVARYCEFRTVSRVLTFLQGKLQQVPCSRADVFSSKIVSLVEKRLMMKFLQFAADYESSPQEYKDYEDQPFKDFLILKKLTPNVQHFVQHAIAMVTDKELTNVALKKTKKYLHSLGRYGNTAFLFPIYGTGELPQAFSRLSAVFGGIYCLTASATHIIADSSNKCCGIVTTNGQRISCRYVVAEESYLPSSYVQKNSARKISRAIFITDSSILSSENSELSLLHYVSQDDRNRPVTVMELPNSACVCPKDVFVVHLTRESGCDDPVEDLKEVRDKLFTTENKDEAEAKSKILWSMYFQQNDASTVTQTVSALPNVLVVPGGGSAGIDLDFTVSEAKKIFLTVCPDEDFLPKPPNPEDIIHVDDTEAAVERGPSEFQDKGDGDGSDKGEGNEEKNECLDNGKDNAEVKGNKTDGNST